MEKPGDRETMSKGLVIIGMVLAAMLWVGTTLVLAQESTAQGQKNENNLYQKLEGRWVRPDGGYILELKSVGGKGEVKAMYFNPRPINVGISSWRKEEGSLTVFVELRDINYQGSTYTLKYDPDSDRLKGTYYQAPTGMTYEVEFLRAK